MDSSPLSTPVCPTSIFFNMSTKFQLEERGAQVVSCLICVATCPWLSGKAGVLELTLEKVSRVVWVLCVAFLGFVAGAFVMLGEVYPSQFFRNAYLASVALFRQRTEFTDPFKIGLWLEARTDARGVTVYDSEKAQNGYTLYTSGHDSKAFLTAMDGTIVHEWSMPYSQVWDASAAVKKPVPDSHIYFRKAKLYPNGDLLVVYDGANDTPYGYGLVKLDRHSNVIWKYLRHVHHDVDVAPDGTVYTLTQEIRNNVYPNYPHLRPPRIDDFLVQLDADGRELRKISVLDSILASDYRRMLGLLPWYVGGNGDYLHTNAVDYIDAETAKHFDFTKAGQILLSIREPGMITVLDPNTARLVWAIRGPWVAQHDPDLLPNGHILLFDNSGRYGAEGQVTSRVIEFDPHTYGIVWRYVGSDQKPLNSAIRSAQERLPNGNTLITESDGGRLLEVTPNHQVVWEYINPVRGGEQNALIPVISWGQRIDPQWLDDAFRRELHPQKSS
jgi:hypothetical protein